MFEVGMYNNAMKLIFYRAAFPSVGGLVFINNLKGKHVEARGLLLNDAVLGPHIIISEQSMILSVIP